MEFIVEPWMMGLIIVSCLLASLGSYLFYILLALITNLEKKPFNENILITSILTGILERAFFTCLIGFGIQGVAIAMIAWITIKSQLHDKALIDNHINVKVVYLGVLSSMGSLFFAIFGGVLWREEHYFIFSF
ncbi:MAG: hypothetical protein B0D91_14410 [Oceanospirillales bacterium LUC14_002_19_P2]|nr:MAG: hypothetical protein B0D91_14410 [Oceanospirillales bacterium LUC14_002_19_P2]